MTVKEEIEKRLQYVETKRLVVGIVLDVVREKLDERIDELRPHIIENMGRVELERFKRELEK